MEFLKNLLRNLAILIVIGLVLLIISPDLMKQVYQFFGALFGPLVILILIVGALPRRRKKP
jgi:Na+/serine symporter